MATVNYLLFLFVLGVFSEHGKVLARDGKIVNGTDAKDGEFPFMVSLRRGVRHSCGATLLNPKWVLTAAHCVARARPENLKIQYGNIKLNQNSTKLGNVSKIYTHEGYLPSNNYINDIALLKLKEPLNFNKKVSSVRLPEIKQITPGNQSATLIGWGLNAVSLRKIKDDFHFCAGTILSPKWILTAAHCFTFVKQPWDVLVHFGSHQLHPHNPKYARVKQILLHEGYSPTLAIHDIALLELSTTLEFNESVKAVILPTMYQNFEAATNVELIGWGLNETFGTLQNILQKVELQLVTLSNCRRELNAFLQESNLCAGDVDQKKGQCSGDSGGPLLHNHNIQIGIVSWSLKPCALKPGVFTSVKHYLSWIYATINRTSKYKV